MDIFGTIVTAVRTNGVLLRTRPKRVLRGVNTRLPVCTPHDSSAFRVDFDRKPAGPARSGEPPSRSDAVRLHGDQHQ